MNRKERRNIIKNNVASNSRKDTMQAVNLALQMQKDEFENSKNAIILETIEIVLTMVAYTIQYKLGLGKKRLPEIIEAILNNIDSFSTGQLSKADFKTIKEEIKKYNVFI